MHALPAPFDVAARDIATHGFSFVPGSAVARLLDIDRNDGAAMLASWSDLPRDPHLADGGTYRFRRHASMIQAFEPPALTDVAYRPHWQPKSYNKLHGGVTRHFEPITPHVATSAAYRALITLLGNTFRAADRDAGQIRRWYVESHQFRIDASNGVGLPTPEGAHRDGVDYVALVLLRRGAIDGGSTTVYDAAGTMLAETTLATPWEIMLLDDARVTHATTAVKPSGAEPYRDTLVVTYRKDGFLDPE